MTEMKRPKGVLFDLGDTILHEVRYEPHAGAKCLLDNASNLPAIERDELERLAFDLYEDVKGHHRQGVIEFSIQSFLRLVCEQAGIEHEMSLTELEFEFWQAVASMRPEPDVVLMLDKLDELQIPRGIVSNAMFSGDVLRWELERNELLSRFSFVMSSADYGMQKPHRALFLAAAKKLGLPPEEIWFVGDNLEKDVTGSSNAGLTGVWYNPKGQSCDLDPKPNQVTSWLDFVELITRANSP